MNAIDLGGYLKLGKHWWNKVSTVGKIIDIIICCIPILAGIAKLAKAGSIAAAASQAAAQLGRKALRESFVKMSVKLSVKTGWPLLATIGGAIFNAVFTLFDTSFGRAIASLIDWIDGKRDGYIFA